MVDYNFPFLKVAIVILAVVAVVAADLYGAAPVYKQEYSVSRIFLN